MSVSSRALAFAALWFDEATVHRVFEPLIADWQREWMDAPASRRSLVLARGAIAFVMTVVMLAPRQWLFASAPVGAVRLVFLRMSVFTAIACAVMATLFMSTREASPERLAWLFALVLPSRIVSLLPFAAAFGVDAVRVRPETSQPERLFMARVAVGVSLLVFTFSGWVVPPVTQKFRLETRGHDIPAPFKGVRELTTSELILNASLTPEREPFSGLAGRDRRVRAELQTRVYLAALPMLLVWLRWKALAWPRKGWLPLPAPVAALLTVVVVMSLYLGGWTAERAFEMPAGIGSWLSIGVLAGWGLLSGPRRIALDQARHLGTRLNQAFLNSRIQ